MFADLPCLKNEVIFTVDDLNNVSDSIDSLIIGNGCLNELNEIDFSRFVYVRMIDIGVDSLRCVKSVVISGLIIYDSLI